MSQPPPTEEELARMSPEEQMRIGAEADGIHIVHRRERFPVPGTAMERRAERQVSAMFLLTFLGAVGFMVVYVVVPWQFKLGDNGGYAWFTPALGVCLGVALFGVGIGAILWAKKLMPEEEVVQDRHDGVSEEFDRQTTAATLTEGIADTGIARRSMLKRSIGLGAGALGLMAIFPLGGLIIKPRGELFRTPWKKGVRMVQIDGRPIRPQDMQPGSLATVFPNVPDGTTAADTPTMLIRLRPGQKVKARKGQGGYMWGDYIAFSKICTHAGCPVSLYEQQTNRLLCPCHQSQFDVLLDAKPIFGPAARPLPQLPITVDDEGYFIANGPYREAIGPAFWERPND
jgi:ubiquinol-cytochrome c reductase iron-sulfur subunit